MSYQQPEKMDDMLFTLLLPTRVIKGGRLALMRTKKALHAICKSCNLLDWP